MGTRLDKFMAQPIEVEISGEKFMIKPFTAKELPLFMKMESKDSDIKSKAIKDIVFLAVKQMDTEATMEQVNNLKLEFVMELMEKIGEVNNIDVSEAKKELLEQNE